MVKIYANFFIKKIKKPKRLSFSNSKTSVNISKKLAHGYLILERLLYYTIFTNFKKINFLLERPLVYYWSHNWSCQSHISLF
jgi:hypothetical protein